MAIRLTQQDFSLTFAPGIGGRVARMRQIAAGQWPFERFAVAGEDWQFVGDTVLRGREGELLLDSYDMKDIRAVRVEWRGGDGELHRPGYYGPAEHELREAGIRI